MIFPSTILSGTGDDPSGKAGASTKKKSGKKAAKKKAAKK